MGKHEDIAALVASLDYPKDSPFHPCYLEYFQLFNNQRYYESHDILEHIWLESEGEIFDFYKALIQFAGAFVHLQLHYNAPEHPTHRRRLHPAVRLLHRSASMLDAFPHTHEGIFLPNIQDLARATAEKIETSNFQLNPWSPSTAPRIISPNNRARP